MKFQVRQFTPNPFYPPVVAVLTLRALEGGTEMPGTAG